MYECVLSAFAIHFQIRLIFGNTLFRCAHFGRICILFFPWEIIRSSTHSSGVSIPRVSCETHPSVWQAGEGVFGCVYVNEAKIGTVNRKQYEADVPFLFFSTFAFQWVSVSGNLGSFTFSCDQK